MDLTSVECGECHYRNRACITHFYIENPYGYCETLHLLQCDRCGAFTIVTFEDSWYDEGHVYHSGTFIPEEAEIIFLFFVACDRYKQCTCEIHEAVKTWIGARKEGDSLFARTALIEKLKADPRYPEWQKSWRRAVLLRGELEAAYTAARTALTQRDFDAFAAAAFTLTPLGDDARAGFPQIADTLLDGLPDLSATHFVRLRSEDDDLAGYYHFVKGPAAVRVLMTRFVNADGRWRVVPRSEVCSFQLEPGEDIEARAWKAEEEQEEESLRLRRPDEDPGYIEWEARWRRGAPLRAGLEPVCKLEPAEPGTDLGPDRAGDESVRAVIRIRAWGYDTRVSINGAVLSCRGGQFSERLVGVAEGAGPAEPAVLRAGENQIEIKYRKTRGQEASRLTVEVMVLPDRCAFRLVTAERQWGTVAATFAVPASEADEIPTVEINGDEPQA